MDGVLQLRYGLRSDEADYKALINIAGYCFFVMLIAIQVKEKTYVEKISSRFIYQLVIKLMHVS